MHDTTKEITKVLRLAIDAERADEKRAARELYARCLAMDASSVAIATDPDDVSERCRAWLCSMSFWRDIGRERTALRLARKAVRRWPERADVYTQLGYCYEELSRFAEAEQAFRRSLAIRARPGTLVLLGNVIRAQDRRAEGMECFREALTLDPRYEEAHYNLGCDLRVEGDYPEAIRHLREAIAIDPDYAVAHAELGSVLLRSPGDRELALVHLRRALELKPGHYWARCYLCVCLWELCRLRQAGAEYAAHVRRRPNDGFVLSLYADFLSSEFGPTAQVEVMFQRAVELDPDDSSIRFHYGKHLLRAKRYTFAEKELRLADRLGHRRALAVLASAED